MSEHTHSQLPQGKKDFNYRITEFFLNNTRLTILALASIVILGLASLFALKTTGFPSPSIDISFLQTAYIGASSETVEKEVTEPLENAIKGVEGVDSFNSSSSDSFSFISIYLESGVNADSVNSKINAAIQGVDLPEGVEKPSTASPNVGGPAFILSIIDEDPAKVFQALEDISADLNQLPETSRVEPIGNEVQRRVVVTLRAEDMAANGLTPAAIQSKISNVGELLPVTSGVDIDGSNTSVVTTVTWQSLEDVSNIEFVATPTVSQAATSPVTAPSVQTAAPKLVKLSDVADVEVDYYYTDSLEPVSAYKTTNSTEVVTALAVQVAALDGTDLAQYSQKIEKALTANDTLAFFAKEAEVEFSNDKIEVVVGYDQSVENQTQVSEVVSGLIGGPLSVDNQALAQIGWVLGGIQLVFLVMLAFVSWRSAIIAALSIPLSLMFSTIYLLLIGESLNTIVLFALVLVIGLVVDPTLVVLESIQRKIDTGLKGKEASLAAIKDVGPGVFLAALTNIIVFAPFGLISGVLGAIFSYLPLTKIPAVVGSYIVPLVFLAWIGGLFLKRNKKSSDNEEENLWPLAKWLIKLNTFLLKRSLVSVLASIFIIGAAIIIPVFVTTYYTSTGQVKVVQFSSIPNSDVMQVAGSFLPDMPAARRSEVLNQVLNTVIADQDVVGLTQVGNGLRYYVNLKPADERSRITNDIAADLDKKLNREFGDDLFSIAADAISYGPPAAEYQIALAVKEKDPAKLQTAAQELGKVMQEVCYKAPTAFGESAEISITENCNGERVVEKVDDGYTNRQTDLIEVLVDPNALQAKGLVVPNAPASLLINQALRNQFAVNNGDKVGSVDIDGLQTEIILEKDSADPQTVEEIKDIQVTSLTGQTVSLGDVAKVTEKSSKASIQRVNGETLAVVQTGMKEGFTDQGTAGAISQAVLDYLKKDEGQKAEERLGVDSEKVDTYSEGALASFAQSFVELIVTLVLAIIASYFVLALFFKSMTQPIVILFSVPLTFIGIFPALAYLSTGELGFLEIIGIIILIGIVENVAIFLIDAANQKIQEEGWEPRKAIAYAAGVRLRPVLLTSITGIASLAPLAIFSQGFRNISLVIMFGLITSAVVSLITTPILFTAFRWLSDKYHKSGVWNQMTFVILPILGFLIPFTYTWFNQNVDRAWFQVWQETPNLNFFLLLFLVPLGYILYWIILEIIKAIKEYQVYRKHKSQAKSKVS